MFVAADASAAVVAAEVACLHDVAVAFATSSSGVVPSSPAYRPSFAAAAEDAS